MGDSVHLHGQEGLQLTAIHLITLHNILEYMQIAIIQTEASDFVKINIFVILKTFGHDCSPRDTLDSYFSRRLLAGFPE